MRKQRNVIYNIIWQEVWVFCHKEGIFRGVIWVNVTARKHQKESWGKYRRDYFRRNIVRVIPLRDLESNRPSLDFSSFPLYNPIYRPRLYVFIFQLIKFYNKANVIRVTLLFKHTDKSSVTTLISWKVTDRIFTNGWMIWKVETGVKKLCFLNTYTSLIFKGIRGSKVYFVNVFIFLNPPPNQFKVWGRYIVKLSLIQTKTFVFVKE